MTLVDADRYSALVSRCTEQRERAEKAEARIGTAGQIFRSILAMDEYEEVAMPKILVMARNWLGLPCPHQNTVMEMRGCRRLVDGQVDDDLHEVEVCKDCGNWEDARANIDRTLAAEERRSRVTEPWKLSDAIALWIRQRHPGEVEIPPWFVPVLKDWRDRAIALEVALACIEPLEKVATIARRQLHKLRAANDPDALELSNALADLPPKEKLPLYGGSPSLRDWADMHGELHEEKP